MGQLCTAATDVVKLPLAFNCLLEFLSAVCTKESRLLISERFCRSIGATQVLWLGAMQQEKVN